MVIPSPNIPVANYGKKLTEDEYNRRVCGLAHGAMTPDQELIVKKDTLNIMIDYKLGQNFPQDKRDALWEIQKKFEKNFAWNLARALVTSPVNILTGVGMLGGLGKPMVRGFAKVLTFDELKDFFGYDDKDMKRLL